ncbi:N-acetyltransferase [Chitinophaga sp. CF118]|uniref:GNAT family N-acetyltransferase n=1 Tax=Chitinophaga sp. CF118 TaxID=1884367 RepID=UPI0015A7193F|nr:GNAT family N-acetyltransferase [Chitinophaga sp. CF118]
MNRIKRLMEYSFDYSYSFGSVYLSDDKNSTALIIFPDTRKTTLKTILWDIKLLITCTGFYNAIKALKREAELKKVHPKISFYYIWMIGTDPAYGNQGIGTTLMMDLIDDSRLKQRPMYVEARVFKTMLWYQKLGFSIYNEFSSSDRKWYCLKRE